MYFNLGASYAAMMNNYLGGSGPASEHLKSLMPELQQYYSSHSEGKLDFYILFFKGLVVQYVGLLNIGKLLSYSNICIEGCIVTISVANVVEELVYPVSLPIPLLFSEIELIQYV